MEVLPVIPKRFKFARGVTWLFLALSMLVLVYTYLRAHNEGITTLQGFLNHSLLKYSVISLIGIIFYGVVLRLKDEIKLNIVIVTTSLIVGCYLIEITLGFLAPFESGQNDSRYNKKGIEYDTRNKFEVWLDLKSKGMDVLPFVGNFTPNNGIPGVVPPLFPLSNVSKKSIVYCNESGKYAIWQSDRYGFRNPDSEWDAPQTEWVLVGDSFTLGACVDSGEDIGGQIRLLRGESVLNLSSGQGGPISQLASLKEYAVFRKPKIVLWLFFEGNDLWNLDTETSSSVLMSYLQPEFSQGLIHRQTEIDNRLNQYILKAKVMYEKNEVDLLVNINRGVHVFRSFTEKTRMLRLFNIRRRLGVDTVPRYYNVRPLFSEVLTKARDRVAAWGGKLYFVYLPEFSRYQLHMKYRGLYKRESNVVNAVKNLNIPIIHIQEVFANHPDPLSFFPFRSSSHYNAEGYSEVAKAVVLYFTGERENPKNHR